MEGKAAVARVGGKGHMRWMKVGEGVEGSLLDGALDGN